MHLPITLAPNSTVLVAGIGGGFDFLCGLPIGLSLEDQGHKVIYANYSFTNLAAVSGKSISPEMIEVSADSRADGETYFPEGFFSQWFREAKGRDVPVSCFAKTGVAPLRQSYASLRERHGVDACLLMDGGVDGIFRGDEYGLGTPSMDSISMIAAHRSGIPRQFYCFTAFGTEGAGNEVAHADALERVADLIAQKGYHGVAALIDADPAARDFVACCDFIFGRMPPVQHSNIVCSVLKALAGRFGPCAVNAKTESSPVWVSPLTSMYWFFDLAKTVAMKLFYPEIVDSMTVAEVSAAIDGHRKKAKRTFPVIPI